MLVPLFLIKSKNILLPGVRHWINYTMRLLLTVEPQLRILKCLAFKVKSIFSHPLHNNGMSLEFRKNGANVKFCYTFSCSDKQRNYNIASHNHCFNFIQHRKLCSAIQNMKNQSNKIMNLLDSETGKLGLKSFFDSVCESKELSIVEWDSFKEHLLKTSGMFNATNFSGQVMKNLLNKNNYVLACSFMSYLEAKSQQPNVFTLSAFMTLSAQNIKECGEEDIISMYDKIKGLKIMDSTLIGNIICSLSATSHWREGYTIYKEAVSGVPLKALNSLACAAFHNHDFEVALKLIENIETTENHDWNDVYIEWMNAISDIRVQNLKESSSLLDKLLSHLCSKEVIISWEVAQLISCYFESLKDEDWKSTLITMSNKQTCPNCNQPLQLLEISTHQHQLLKEAVLSKVIKGSDVYLNTTPAELDRFKKFLTSTIPYDIVVDGLNVAYYYLHNTSNSERARQLSLVVNHFAKHKGMKTLVLGRNHMKKWPKVHMEAIADVAKIFYADNLSKDDPFILYAALVSGPQTMVLTKDLLRNHKFLLQDPLLGTYFERWRKSHQIFLTRVNPSGSVVCEEPLPYSIVVQGSMKEGWHIPYKPSDDTPKSVYDFHKNWLCIKNKLH